MNRTEFKRMNAPYFVRHYLHDLFVHLFQLLAYPDLTVRTVVDLEPGRLLTTFPVPLRDDPLSSPPVEMDLGIKV